MGIDRESPKRRAQLVSEIVSRACLRSHEGFHLVATCFAEIEIRSPVWIIILWNANGAAIFKPAYFYFLSRSGARSRDATIPVNDAMAVFAVTLPVMACPLLLFVPAWLNYSTWDHHGFIALFHLTPVLIFGLFMIIANVLSATYGTTTEKESKAPSADKPWIIASLTVAGTIAAGVHIFTVLASLKTTDPDATLARLLIPSHGRANPFPSWITTVDSTRKGLPAEYTAMLEECHLFSQYDWIVICLSVILFLRLLRAEPGAEGLDASAKRVEMHWRDCGYLAWGTILFGPGAAGSFALAAQESRTREQAQTNQLQ